MKKPNIKKYLFLFFLAGFFAVTLQNVVLADSEKNAKKEIVKITGVIIEIYEDKNCIIVNNKTLFVNKKFIRNSLLKIGDRVRILARKTENKLEVISIQFNYKNKKDDSEGKQELPEDC